MGVTGEGDRDDVADLYAFRLALERVAARAAAARKLDLRRQVARWHLEGDVARAEGDVDALVALDTAFHVAIAEGAGNPYVVAALRANGPRLDAAVRLYLTATTMRDAIWDEHAEIAQAIAAGDADLAEALLGAHIQESGNVVLSRLANGGAVPCERDEVSIVSGAEPIRR